MSTITIDFSTAKVDLSDALTLITLKVDAGAATPIGSLTKPATVSAGVITIPDYGTYTIGTNTFKADAALTGTLALTKGTIIPLVVDLSSATADLTYSAGAEITKITGGAGSDTITGGLAAVDITGGAGNDSITATAANASVVGGAGNDVLTASGAGDTLTGGDGADTFAVDVSKATTVTDYKYAQADALTLAAAFTGNEVLTNAGLFNEKAATPNVAVTAEAGTDNVYKVKATAAGVTKEFWTAKKDTAAVTLDASALNVGGVINTGAATSAVVKGSANDDAIILTGSKATLQAGTAAGTDVITGFDGGFTGDVLNLTNVALMDVKWGAAGANTTIGSSQISGAGVAADAGKILVQVGSGTAQKVSFDAKGAATLDGTEADVYMGSTLGTTVLNVANTTVEGTAINLSDTTKYKNISKVKGATYVAGTYIGAKNAADATKGTNFDLAAATKASEVWGGTGAADTIALNATNAVRDAVWFGTTDGTDTVTGFKGGFAATSDVVNLYNVADLTKLTFGQGAGVTDVAITAASGNTIDVQGAGAANAAQLLLKDSAGVVKKVAVGTKTGAAIAIDGVGADMVIGWSDKTNKVAYGATQTADLVVNLQDTSVYKNIKSVDLTGIASAYNVVVGAKGENNTIVLAGTKTDVWGGSSKADAITAGTGVDTIWFGAGDGADVVTGFASAKDKVKFYDKTVAQIAAGYSFDGTDLFKSKTAGVANTLQITGATVGATHTIIDKDGNEVKAVLGAGALNYNKNAKLYMGSAVGGVTVNVTGNDNVVLYLGNGVNGTVNDIYFSGVTGINASTATGQTVLIGSSTEADTLQAGTTSSAMWGGGAAADTMVGGAGTDQFWFGNGDGADVVNAGVDKKDTIVLHNITSIADVTMTLDNAGLFVIGTANGSSLTVTDTTGGNYTALDNGLTFQFGVNADAKNYTYNRISKSFVAK